MKLYEMGDLPDCIYAVNDGSARGAYKAIREKRLDIPEDIGIVAFSHHEFAELLYPQLTIIDSPPVLIGKTAMELLLSEMNQKPERIQRLILETKLVPNHSIINRTLAI